MFPEPTELLLIGLFDRINLDPKIQIKYIDTKNQLADTLTKGKFHTWWMESFLCLFNISHVSSINNLEAISKRTPEDAGGERVTAKSKPMMNLVSRYSERTPNVLVSTASKSPGETRHESQFPLSSRTEQSPVKTKSEFQNVPLSSLDVQQTSTVRPVMGASSSNYSEWNIDGKWSSQEWKSGEVFEARRWAQWVEQFTQDTDKFVLDDDMDSDTATESNHFFKITIILEQGEWSIAKDVKFSRRRNARHRQTFYDLVIVFLFNIGSMCIHGKELLRQFAFHQKFSAKSHFKKDVRDITTVDIETIGWDFLSVSNQLGKFSMETIISGQWWRSHQSLACKGLCILRYCVMSWKGESEPSIKYCLGKAAGLVQRFTTIQNFGHNWRRTDGIRVEYFPRVHYIVARPRSPKVHEQNERPWKIPRTDHLHVFVQWHHMVNWRQRSGMYRWFHTCVGICQKIPAGHWSFLGPGSETKWYSTYNKWPQGEMGQSRWIDDDQIQRKRTPSFPIHESIVSRNAQKQRRWKNVYTLLCRWWYDWNFCTIISVNQPSIYGAVSCVWGIQYLSNKNGETRIGRTIWPIVRSRRLVDNDTQTFDWDSCTRRPIAKVQGTSGKASTTRSIDKDLYWCRIPENNWSRTIFHDKAQWRIF